ncbi:MAG: hypothetical protein NUW00_01385 [Candidatus Kaiserbacteria bacterium]|nr:hypothetical protein [Candidatus Kaiserbacteria bacterium]
MINVTGTGLGLFVAKKNCSPTETVHLQDIFKQNISEGLANVSHTFSPK